MPRAERVTVESAEEWAADDAAAARSGCVVSEREAWSVIGIQDK